MTKRSAQHATFTIERDFAAAPARVFKAFADQKEKDKWFGGPDEWDRHERSMDFRVGGRERSSGGPKGGEPHSFDAYYWDIVPNERIVYSYDMHLGDKRISVSLATIEFKPKGSGTHLVLTEQGVFLDGYDDAGSREEGTRWLLGKLEATLG
ncbi:MAG: SRPBCC family protein [Alphaproteobacteria bacterium]